MSNLLKFPSSNVEVVSKEEALFLQGREIGDLMENGLRKTVLSFYQSALEWAYRVIEAQPWDSDQYKQYKVIGDVDASYLSFLKASLSQSGESLVSHQVAILKMMTDRGWTIDMVDGIGLKRLWRISNVSKYLSPGDQEKILVSAKNDRWREFDSVVKSLKAGYNIEPLTDKLISGSQSSIKMIDEYVNAHRKAGDNRMHGEIIADAVGSAMYSESDFRTERDIAIINLLCDVMRHFYKDYKTFSNVQIQSTIAEGVLNGYVDELPAHLLKRYNEIIGQKEETKFEEIREEEE